MILWFALAAMILVTMGPLLFAVLRQRTPAAARAAHELAIYRDQLATVRREAAQGLLTPEEQQAAELEISRHMLAAQAATGADADPASTPAPGERRRGLIAAALVTVLVPAGAVGLYLAVGAPGVPGYPLAARQDLRAGGEQLAEHGDVDVQAMVQRLAERLESQPDDLDGWTLLARSYAAQGAYQKAAEAYSRARELSGDHPDIVGAYAEVLVLAAEGMVTPAANELFEKLSRENPQDPRPRYYLGAAQAQAGDGKGALETWLALEADSPPDAPWLPPLRQNIERVAAQYGVDVAALAPDRQAPPAPTADAAEADGPAGPTAEEVAAAQSMDADQQMQMIRSMVDRLATRLEQEPGDVEGWLRLANAYVVLGESEPAKAAVRRAAAAAVEAPAEQMGRIVQLAGQLGVELEGAGDGAPAADPAP